MAPIEESSGEALAAVDCERKVAKAKKRQQREEAAAPTSKRAKKDKVATAATPEKGVPTAAAESPEDVRAKMMIMVKSDVALPDPVQSFDAAPFSKAIRAALKDAGFPAPTAVQAQGWPVAKAGSDLVAVAKTGSGKTLGFWLPALRWVTKSQPDASKGPAVLVLAPTRELAVQIQEASEKYTACTEALAQVVYGGVAKPPQAKQLKSSPPHLLVATPGRLVDLMGDGAVKLGNVSFLVLDEADRMLDMGFEPQMDQIMAEMPAERQTLLFTATWPKQVKKLAAKYLRDTHVHLNIGETEELAANKAVSQEFFKLSDDEKEAKLWKIMDGMQPNDKMLVFANTKRRIENLSKVVLGNGYDCVAMHGDKPQWERDKGLAKFVSGEAQVMFATDVCSRGLDIKAVSHVVNFDMARDVESYVHRIGRTGRGGATGTSITFFNEDYDLGCAPTLAKIAREAGQAVPAFLEKAAAKGSKETNKLWKY